MSGFTLIPNELQKPDLDDRNYRFIRLQNNLEALLISDASTDRSSAALAVGVGSFSDSKDMPGLAHAVEHALFMGTKKFPQENDYDSYLCNHGGASNAYTDSNATVFYFELAATVKGQSVGMSDESSTSDASSSESESPSSPSQHSSIPGSTTNSTSVHSASAINETSATETSALYGALDRFAQFFIAPLFSKNSLDRELRAVDSENKGNLQDDYWRLDQLNRSLSTESHPFSNFSTGNYKTLHDDPISNGINIRDRFIEFYNKYYSANLMKLVVLGREPLDTLQDWVVKLFSPVKNKDLKPNRWDMSPYSPENVPTVVYAKPVFDQRSVEIFFPYPDQSEIYQEYPAQYISHLIGHEGPGSILVYLRNAGWAEGLGVDFEDSAPGSAMFRIQVKLTEEGLSNYEEVLEIIFQYIAMLKDETPQKWFNDEINQMSGFNFRFSEKRSASKTTRTLCAMMHKPFKREHLLSHACMERSFNPKVIMESLKCLRPGQSRVMIVSRKFPGDWNEKEKWYGTEYRYEKMKPALLEKLTKAVQSKREDRPKELHLPMVNEFIPANLMVNKRPVTIPRDTPRLLRNDSKLRVWHKRDDQFWVPRAFVHMCIRSPLGQATPRIVSIQKLYAGLVMEELKEYAYAAEIAGLEFQLNAAQLGFEVVMQGYNDKMPVLLERGLECMRNLEIKRNMFDIVKDKVLRAYQNFFLMTPYEQIDQYMQSLIIEKQWSIEEVLGELETVTPEEVAQMYPSILKQSNVEMCAIGNVGEKEVEDMSRIVETSLKFQSYPSSQWGLRRSFLIPRGSNYAFDQLHQDPDNLNNCIEYMLHITSHLNRNIRAKAALFARMVYEPIFNQLRTKEQLGYIVTSASLNIDDMVAFIIVVQSERNVEYLEERIEEFLVKFEDTLKSMSIEQFEKYKLSVRSEQLEKLKNLNEEALRFWRHIMSERYDFTAHQSLVENLDLLTLEDMIAFYREFIHPESKTRSKLTVRINARVSQPEDVSTALTTTSLNGSSRQLITDVRKFKSGLELGKAITPVKDLNEYIHASEG